MIQLLCEKGDDVMCVTPIHPTVFRSGKIELNAIPQTDLQNYAGLEMLAKQNFCDLLIEKSNNEKIPKDYNVFRIIARRKGLNQKYVFGDDTVTVRKSTPLEEVAKKIYDASARAVKITKAKVMQVAKTYIKA